MATIDIKSQIEEWQDEAQSSGDDYWTEIARYLKEFQDLTGVDKYVSEDAEHYWDETCYVDLLNEISDITQPEIQITDIEGKSENEIWEFSFKINGELNQIKMNSSGTDWLQEEFINSLNACIARSGECEKKLKMVFATTLNNTDQCFDMAFIDESTFDKLVNHPRVYAEKID